MEAPVPARVALLGGFRLTVAGQRVPDLPRGVQRLIAYVGLANRPARSAVAGELWPEVPEAQATGSLRSALWRVHRVAPRLIETSGGALALAPEVRVDVRETVRWARLAVDLRADVPDSWPADEELCGDLLPGWYDDWVLVERERVRQLHVYALEAVGEKLAGAGRYGEAVNAAYTAIRMDPLRESAHRTLVRIHRAEGNLVEASHAYESFRALLRAEIGASPSARMQALGAGLRPCPTRSTVVPLRPPRPGAVASTGRAARMR
ncbi:BTAD domain-containing putative transcriptional regulator [Geodermatophilus sp. SYSU D00691]